ncbi:MAG: SDR family oxidoreductase [Acidobacteriota bacterium]
MQPPFIKKVEKIPLKRLAGPMDIAYVALFLAMDELRYTTGQFYQLWMVV